MAFEPGGRADKLGNRYEGRWLVKQLIKLLDEKIQSVTVEAIGDEEKGVDIWITRKDGSRQAQQCKARNAHKESWSVSDLKTIIPKMCFQLDQNANYDFTLVSGLPCTSLGDICHSARNSPGDPALFYEHQIKRHGKQRLSVFNNFCRVMDLDIEREEELARAFDYLKRITFFLYPFDQNTLSHAHFDGHQTVIV